jgi:hypothetical protein
MSKLPKRAVRSINKKKDHTLARENAVKHIGLLVKRGLQGRFDVWK